MKEDINEEEEITYKFILVGDISVGKTCILKKTTKDKFYQNTQLTLGIEYHVLYYEIEVEENGKKIKKNLRIKFYDSAGNDFRRVFPIGFVNKSNGIIIVYDITNRESFNHVTKWIKFIEEDYSRRNEEMKACMFLIGNKNDLVEGEEGEKRREVQINEGKILAEKYGFIWGGECSAKEYPKKQFDEILIKFAKIIYSKYGYEKQDKDIIALNNKNIKKERKSCNC